MTCEVSSDQPGRGFGMLGRGMKMLICLRQHREIPRISCRQQDQGNEISATKLPGEEGRRAGSRRQGAHLGQDCQAEPGTILLIIKTLEATVIETEQLSDFSIFLDRDRCTVCWDSCISVATWITNMALVFLCESVYMIKKWN